MCLLPAELTQADGSAVFPPVCAALQNAFLSAETCHGRRDIYYWHLYALSCILKQNKYSEETVAGLIYDIDGVHVS